MDEKLKARWVKALRSGKYKQGKRGLYNNDGNNGHCCLGVLCRVARARLDGDRFEYGGESEASYLPDPLADRAKVDGCAQRELAHMNDTGKSFTDIADYIEREL